MARKVTPLMKNDQPGAERGQHHAADRRAEGPRGVELRGVQGHGVEQEVPGHELGDEGLPGRDVEPVGEAAQRDQGEDHAEPPLPRRPDHPQEEGERQPAWSRSP